MLAATTTLKHSHTMYYSNNEVVDPSLPVKHRYGTRLAKKAIHRVNYVEPEEDEGEEEEKDKNEEDMDVIEEPAVNISTEGVDSKPVRVRRLYVDPDPEYTPYIHWSRSSQTPVEAPANAHIETPANTHIETPANAQIETPANAHIEAPSNAHIETLVVLKKHQRPTIPLLAIPLSDEPLLNEKYANEKYANERDAIKRDAIERDAIEHDSNKRDAIEHDSNKRYATERKIIERGSAFCVVGYQTYKGSDIDSMMVFSNMRDAMLYGEYLVEIGGIKLIDFINQYRNNREVMAEIMSVFPEDLREEIHCNLFNMCTGMDDYHITVIYDNHKKLLLSHMRNDSFRRELLLEYSIEKLKL